MLVFLSLGRSFFPYLCRVSFVRYFFMYIVRYFYRPLFISLGLCCVRSLFLSVVMSLCISLGLTFFISLVVRYVSLCESCICLGPSWSLFSSFFI